MGKPAGALFLLLPLMARACSNFAMEDQFKMSARTEDLGQVPYDFVLVSTPRGSPSPVHRSPAHGFVAFTRGDMAPISLNASQGIKAGMNDAGLSCDKQTLLNSQYQPPNSTAQSIDAALLCRWALEGFSTVRELQAALPTVRFVQPLDSGFDDGHWALRDSTGAGLVLEFILGELKAYPDNNDGGETGFGIMTNEPAFPWQLEAVRHLKWKRTMARPAVSMPGSWYPDERFQRIFLVKTGMPEPASYQDAVAHAVHVLNTVTVPMGDQIGTDSGTGEGQNDHTHFGVLYDHLNATIYWRSSLNQNLQRLRLADAGLEQGGQQHHLLVESPELPWFTDAAVALMQRS